MPIVRQINGGTVFKVTYEPEELWDNSMRGAFEYACKIWEEQLPNSLPINILAKIGNIRGTNNMNLLSKVQSTTYDFANFETFLSSRMKYVLLGFIRSESEDHAKLFDLLYTKDLTTEQIGEISDEFMDVLILT